jgi:glycosyltransferase involved in cell wall biosynthesis
MKVSAAMCTYNAGSYLKEQLDSILSQTRLPDELVIADDGSSDGTWETLEDFARKAPFPVRAVRNEKTLGYSRNFAHALDLCSGDVLVLSDQDDRWHPARVERMEEIFLREKDAGGVFSNGWLMNSGSETLPGDLWSSFAFGAEDQRRIESGEAVRVLIQRNVVTGMALAIRAEWKQVMQSMPDHWPHDAWLALMLASDNKLRPCPEKLVTYRVHMKQQIGVPATSAEKTQFIRERGLPAYLRATRERNQREYTREAIQFESLVCAAQKNAELRNAWWFPLAEAKARHARRGVELLELDRRSRMKLVLPHWREYAQYSPTGSRAFWRDLVV